MTKTRWIGPGALAFLAIWFLLLAGGGSKFLNDPGTFWHIQTGELILTDGFMHADPYTFSFAGTWWIPTQWFGEVAMALGHRAGGFDVLVLGAVTIIAALFAWLAVRLGRTGLHPVAVGMIVLLALAATASHFHVRPHLFTIVSMAITVAMLVDVDAGRASLQRLLWLVPLFVLWTNIHGGVLGGMATVVLAGGGWIAARIIGRPSPVRSIADAAWVVGIAAACLLTAVVNPYGLDLVRMWQNIMGDAALKFIIQEHRPIDPAQPYAWPVIGLAAAYLLTLAGVRWRELRVSWFLPLVWLVLAFDRLRHAPLFAVAAVIGIAAVWPQTRWARWLAQHRPDFYQPRPDVGCTSICCNCWFPALVVLLAFVLQVRGVAVPVVGAGWARHDPQHWPVELLDVLKQYEPRSPGEPNHLFNDYIDGGFVIYHAPGYKVFVDDRCEVFGGDWLVKFVEASSDGTAAAMEKWQRDHGRFDFALTRTGTGFDDFFRTAPEWELVKRTDTASFYRRIEAATRAE
jgi:hypothetical protein